MDHEGKTSIYEESSIKLMKNAAFFSVFRKIKCLAPWASHVCAHSCKSRYLPKTYYTGKGWSLLYPVWSDLRPGSRGSHWVTEVFHKWSGH